MKTTFAVAALLAAASSVLAAPAVESRQAAYLPCSGLYNTAQCCATDVLGVADLDCHNPTAVPLESAAAFQKDCADLGQRARCCVLPILGQGILCQTPAGIEG